MKNKGKKLIRKDFLKGLAAIPFLGYFALNFRNVIAREADKKHRNFLDLLKIDDLEAPKLKLLPPAGCNSNTIRIGLISNGWRGEQLLQSFGYIHPEQIRENTVNGKYNDWLKTFLSQEDLKIEFAGVCDTFSVHAQRGFEITSNVIGIDKFF